MQPTVVVDNGVIVVVLEKGVVIVDSIEDKLVMPITDVELAVDPIVLSRVCLVVADCVVLAADGVLLVVVEGVTVVEAVVRFSVINGVVRVLVDAVDVDAAVDVVWH